MLFDNTMISLFMKMVPYMLCIFESSIFRYGVTVPILLLLAWRIFRFTIQPFFKPDAPKELPYWIPFVGNVTSVMRGLDAVVGEGMKYCCHTGEPFSIQVFGQKIYFVLSEADMAACLRDHPALTHMDHLRDLLETFGSSRHGLFQMYQSPSPDLLGSNEILPNPKRKPMALLAEDIMNKQLRPGAHHNDLLAQFLHIVDIRTQWRDIPAPAVLSTSADGDRRTVSLLKWAQYAVLEAMTTAWFGTAIWDLSSTIISDMIHLDEGIWKLFYKLPKPWSRDIRAAQERLYRCMFDYLRLPQSQKNDRSWAAGVSEDGMRMRGISEEDMASHLLVVFWGINANIFKVAFWLLANICSDPALFRSFAAEIDDAIMASESATALSMVLEKSTPLMALYNENLRLINNSSSERTILEKCTINGKTYQPGARILLTYRQLAMTQSVFGMDSSIFRPERFLLDESLGRSRSFIPFGGGKHMCPGRFITRRASLTFAALVVHRFQTDPIDALPDMELAKPPLGPVEPAKRSDMRLSISRRQNVYIKDWKK